MTFVSWTEEILTQVSYKAEKIQHADLKSGSDHFPFHLLQLTIQHNTIIGRPYTALIFVTSLIYSLLREALYLRNTVPVSDNRYRSTSKYGVHCIFVFCWTLAMITVLLTADK
jgi:hypothetical protein